MNVLDNIIENRKKELTNLKKITSVRDLEQSILFDRKSVSLSEFLLD